jgi:hypothetical protein
LKRGVGYMVLNPYRGIVAGARFDMTADDVIEFCKA